MTRRPRGADDPDVFPVKRPARPVADDLPLFVAPSVAVDTSEDAAEKVRPRVKDAHRVILALLVMHEYLACYEIEQRTGWEGNFTRPRLWELEGLQWIRKTGVKRPTPRGATARCYTLTPLGRLHAQRAAAA